MEISVTQFKARCLKLIKQVHAREENSVVITKRGKPLAKLVPIEDPEEELFGCMRGLAVINGDLTAPTGEDWDALRD